MISWLRKLRLRRLLRKATEPVGYTVFRGPALRLRKRQPPSGPIGQ